MFWFAEPAIFLFTSRHRNVYHQTTCFIFKPETVAGESDVQHPVYSDVTTWQPATTEFAQVVFRAVGRGRRTRLSAVRAVATLEPQTMMTHVARLSSAPREEPCSRPLSFLAIRDRSADVAWKKGIDKWIVILYYKVVSVVGVNKI